MQNPAWRNALILQNIPMNMIRFECMWGIYAFLD